MTLTNLRKRTRAQVFTMALLVGIPAFAHGQSPAAGSSTAAEAVVDSADHDGINLRSRPNYHGRRIRLVHRGTRLTIVAHQAGWSEVQLSDGTTGWMDGKYLATAAASSANSAASQPPATGPRGATSPTPAAGASTAAAATGWPGAAAPQVSTRASTPAQAAAPKSPSTPVRASTEEPRARRTALRDADQERPAAPAPQPAPARPAATPAIRPHAANTKPVAAKPTASAALAGAKPDAFEHAQPASAVTAGDVFRLMLCLVPVLGVTVLAVRGLKAYQQRTGLVPRVSGNRLLGGVRLGGFHLASQRKPEGRIRVIESAPIGAASLHLVEVRGRTLLVGAAASSVTNLLDLTADDEERGREFRSILNSQDLELGTLEDEYDDEGGIGTAVGSLEETIREAREAIIRAAGRTRGWDAVE